MISDANLFVYVIATDEGEERFYVSPLPHDHGFKFGLRPEAIFGELTNGPEAITPEQFKPNPEFTRFLGFVIAKHSRQCPGVVAEAQRTQNGHVYILDGRTPTPDDGVPPEDIIGAIEVRDGTLLRYLGSPNHRVFTKDGFLQLDSWLHARLLEELMALSVANDGG